MPSTAPICTPPGARLNARSHRRRRRALGHARFSHDQRLRRPRGLLRRALLIADLGGIDARCEPYFRLQTGTCPASCVGRRFRCTYS